MAYEFNDAVPTEMTPARTAFAITPNDSTDLAVSAKALWVGVLGDVKVITVDGDTVTFVGVQGVLPVACSRVIATLTTATDIVGLI